MKKIGTLRLWNDVMYNTALQNEEEKTCRPRNKNEVCMYGRCHVEAVD